MNIVAAQVGIDVSKAENLVSIDQGKPFRVQNGPNGFAELIKRLPLGSVVHLESSGGYERPLRKVLRAAGFQVHAHNPLKARRLAEGLGAKAKTDPVDAKGLSASAHLLLHSKPKSEERENLADFSRMITAIQEAAATFKRRLGAPGLDTVTVRETRALIKQLDARVLAMEKKFFARVKVSSVAGEYALILSVPGVGPKTARICLCELPENLPEQSTGQISSYAGLAPIDDESGQRTGIAHIGRGNSRLKAALYMPALGAVQKQHWAKEIYARLRAKGRSHQGAIIAVMRRLLVRVVTVLKRGSSWQSEPPKAVTERVE
jgi:transposase